MALQDRDLRTSTDDPPKFSPREVYYRRLLAELLSGSTPNASESLQNSCRRALAGPLAEGIKILGVRDLHSAKPNVLTALEVETMDEAAFRGEWNKPDEGYYDIIDAAYAAKASGSLQWSVEAAQWQVPPPPDHGNHTALGLEQLTDGATGIKGVGDVVASSFSTSVDVLLDEDSRPTIENREEGEGDDAAGDDDSYVPPGYPGHDEWRERQTLRVSVEEEDQEDSRIAGEGEITNAEACNDGRDAVGSSKNISSELQTASSSLLDAILAATEASWEEDSEEIDDEWRNDMDPGYVVVPISEDEFLDLEEEAQAAKLSESHQDDETTGSFIDPPTTTSRNQQSIDHAGKALSCFPLKVIQDPFSTGFEDTSELVPSVGEVVAGRYEVEELLGSAAFSVALRCKDLALSTDLPDTNTWQLYGGAAPHERHTSVCLKMIKNNKDFFDQSLDEIKLLRHLNASGDPDETRILTLLDSFYYKEHLFIVSEVLRENLYEFNKYVRDSGSKKYFTIPRLCRVSRQVLTALEFLHSHGIMHCDIKPENILIESYSRVKVKLIDFGSSCFTTDRLTSYVQSRSYRAPEVCLGLPYDGKIDVWSLGAVLAELFTGYVLFQNDSIASMLARISSICGKFPEHMIRRGTESGKYFSGYNIIYERSDSPSKAMLLLYRKKTSLRRRLHLSLKAASLGSSAHDVDQQLFLSCLKKMLSIDPTLRWTSAQLLEHDWIIRGLALEEAGMDLTYLVEEQSTDTQDSLDPEAGSDYANG